ncbi:Saccharopine dehydrogenase-domain-containing protein [Boletus reticuloceps]|uniref:Saccharopine dehydrogenase-domain-containing protein n=1 Tax=Boletus reticuloceps TaxID=495285 RepID=A0A8I2YJB9_9AGAM|nr:Saccharopine dehydrogenase-domain-containing protein [Boletus reticuloceps]
MMLKRAVHVRQASFTTVAPSSSKLTIGIRRENPARIWERRCPLTPDAVASLVQEENVDVFIQDCDRRVFPVHQFVKAGARTHPNLDSAHIVLGIKEPPLNELITSPTLSPWRTASFDSPVPRTHFMFSHTTKGQPYNMELLSRFLSHPQRDLPSRLIDYELLMGPDGKRTVAFGWFAGVAGALEALSALAHAHLELGVASPFLHTPRPHTHVALPSLRAALRAIGEEIVKDGTPKSLGPFVIGLTGNGNVSQGALSILGELPIVKVRVEDLPVLVNDPDTDLHKLYLVHATPAEYLSRTDGGCYDRAHYYENPSIYKSEFATKVAPYLTLFLNGVGWLPGFPRLMTNDALITALARAAEVGPARFGTIGDITCDIEGGLEFMSCASTISEPFFKYRPRTLPAHLPSVQIMSVDILPSTLSLDASEHFCRVLMPYLKTVIQEYRGQSGKQEYSEALERATVAKDGQLQETHTWLEAPLDKWRRSASKPEGSPRKKKVLMLGSGMVAGPTVQELCKRSDVELIVASNSCKEAEDLTRGFSNASARFLDVEDRERVSQLVGGADVIISLLPVPFHPSIAELCIRHGKHMVTASYISPAMRALHDRAESANVVLLNEIGLDPGIDHCSALSLLRQLEKDKKRVLSFTSFCGGLPAPEASDVPLGYKFSWSPRGVLNAALNSARFKLNEETVEIPGENVLRHYFPDLPISNDLNLEGIANRDSLPYADTYGLGKLNDLRTVLRGTLRYPGFANLMDSFKSMGLLNTDPSSHILPRSWSELARLALEARIGEYIPADPNSFDSALSNIVPGRQHLEHAVAALQWLGLVPSSSATNDLPLLPTKPLAPIDLFTTVLAHKLRYTPGERDLVVLSHEIVAQPASVVGEASPDETEVYTSLLVSYGTASASAMSRCVGLPVAFATLAVLDGKVVGRGVQGPTEEMLYRAVLDGLKGVGLEMKEGVRMGSGMETRLGDGLHSTGLARIS